ncbi:hypothetical protein, partial [Rhizobium wenxiniae]|uniref:hypothetical protein n=1 Tax=Rhizobium wenxiniae TaxID=1737357 RepID=UPI0016657E9F
LPETTVSRNGENTATKTVVDSYSVNATTKPYRAFNTVTETTLNEGGASLVLRKERAFDNYGNLTYIRDFGRKDLTGDETWTGIGYMPNTANYVVSLPRIKWIQSGGFDSTTSVLEKQTTYYYDGSTVNKTPPATGNMTLQLDYFNNTTGTRRFTHTYDANGNRLSTVDGA